MLAYVSYKLILHQLTRIKIESNKELCTCIAVTCNWYQFLVRISFMGLLLLLSGFLIRINKIMYFDIAKLLSTIQKDMECLLFMLFRRLTYFCTLFHLIKFRNFFYTKIFLINLIKNVVEFNMRGDLTWYFRLNISIKFIII